MLKIVKHKLKKLSIKYDKQIAVCILGMCVVICILSIYLVSLYKGM